VTGVRAVAPPRQLSPGRKLALAAEILLAYARARRALRRRSLPAVAAAMRRSPDRPPIAPESAYFTGLRLGAAVTRVLRALPCDPRCLTASLVLAALLARRGIPATLVIGVRPDPFAAHAWVEHGGQPLLPPAAAPFERLLEI
jgi:Transglutaminase-like superfamily